MRTRPGSRHPTTSAHPSLGGAAALLEAPRTPQRAAHLPQTPGHPPLGRWWQRGATVRERDQRVQRSRTNTRAHTCPTINDATRSAASALMPSCAPSESSLRAASTRDTSVSASMHARKNHTQGGYVPDCRVHARDRKDVVLHHNTLHSHRYMRTRGSRMRFTAVRATTAAPAAR